MAVLKGIAITIIAIYLLVSLLLFLFQTRLIFFPGKLNRDFRFQTGEEVFLESSDGERINGLFFEGTREEVILYFHGNAGDLSGWQFVAEDFTSYGFPFFIIDYRGYGKSTGEITEEGLYRDAEAAWDFLVNEKGIPGERIIIYGRSIGSGVAVDLASRKRCKGLVLEAPYSSFPTLANEKLPLLFPGVYVRFRFDNTRKINDVKAPIIFLHGKLDAIIPESHTRALFETFQGKKQMVLFEKGSHNDLNAFPEHKYFMEEVLPAFF